MLAVARVVIVVMAVAAMTIAVGMAVEATTMTRRMLACFFLLPLT